jgi:hypothetical protein
MAMRFPWRLFFLLGAIGLVTMLFFIISTNLRLAAIESAVRARDAASVRRQLGRQPNLVATKVMPQGSASRSGTRWRGQTLIYLVATDSVGGATDVAEALLEAGADLDARMDGDTLLHSAAAAGNIPMMTWLLDKGADVNARNGCEHPADAVCMTGKLVNLQPAERRGVSEVCAGCDREGQTPLHAAQRSRAYEGSGLLLARGADVHAVDAAGRTALHVTALEVAASHEPRVLCAYGADPAQRDARGKTPADLAREAEAAKSVNRFSTTGPGELAGWLEPGGPCTRLAARARPGAPVPADEVDAAWRAYVCERDPKSCQR